MESENYKYFDATADAMMVAQAYLWNRPNLKRPELPDDAFSDQLDSIDHKLERRSVGQCAVGALSSISYLQERHGDLFRYLFLMTLDNRPSKDGKQYYSDDAISGFEYHTVFLAHTSDEQMWFAGSPANYLNSLNDMTNLMSSGDLDEILNQVHQTIQGDWPHAADIYKCLVNYEAPVVHRSMELALYHSHFHRYQGIDSFDYIYSAIPELPVSYAY